MKRLNVHITIGNFVFTSIVDVTIESSWDMFTDTCTITIPRKLRWKGKNIALGESALIRKSDKVIVKLGYDNEAHTMFQGYVTAISTGVPVEIQCQDGMYLLKLNTLTTSFKDTDLDTLLSTIMPSDVPFSAPAVKLGPFRISNATPAKVLEVLKQNYYLKSFLRDGKLYTGLAYITSLQKEQIIQFNRDVPIDGNELIYQRSDDINIKLKMISISENQRIEYEAGDADGEQRTKYYYDYSLEDMKAIADDEIERLKYDGYKGSLTIFGNSFNHGDIINLKDDSYPERNGRYLIKKVVTTFGQNGFRQKLELDTKI